MIFAIYASLNVIWDEHPAFVSEGHQSHNLCPDFNTKNLQLCLICTSSFWSLFPKPPFLVSNSQLKDKKAMCVPRHPVQCSTSLYYISHLDLDFQIHLGIEI